MLKVFNQSRYITFSIFALFLLAEISLRIFRSEQSVLNVYPTIYSFDPKIGYRGIPNVEGYIRKPSINKHFKLNNQGFYGPDFSAEHPDSIFRIMIFGASIIEGIWSNQKESIGLILDRKFKSAGYKVEVINCGMSGPTRTRQNILLVKELASKFKPNLVLFEQSIPIISGNYYKDMYDGYSTYFCGDTKEQMRDSWLAANKKVDLVKKHKLISDFLDDCYCFRQIYPKGTFSVDRYGTIQNFMRTYYSNSSDSWIYYKEEKLSLKESMKVMENFKAYLHQWNVELVMFEYGDTWIESNHEVRLADISLDLPLVDPKYCHELDSHPNELGYNLIADGLYKNLRARFIPAKFAP